MSVQLNIAGYDQLNQSINEFLSSGRYSSVVINIFSDQAATVPVVDGHGEVKARKIASVNVVQPHNDVNGNRINGYITIAFTDGSSIISTDNVNNYWYTLDGLAFQHRTFGTPI